MNSLKIELNFYFGKEKWVSIRKMYIKPKNGRENPRRKWRSRFCLVIKKASNTKNDQTENEADTLLLLSRRIYKRTLRPSAMTN